MEDVFELNNRFWNKVEKTDTCWNWKASGRGSGYGCFKYLGKTYDAHRFCWFLITGNWPKDLILHECNNRKCVRPTHLYEGTARNNVRDAINAGTFPGKRGKIYTKHGTITMYAFHKCRCEKCKEAKSIALKRQRKLYAFSSGAEHLSDT